MRPDLTDAFQRQSRTCTGLGSPFMGRLMALLPGLWWAEGGLARLCDAWAGPVNSDGASLPLRIAGGLHALVLSGAEPDLAAAYPPHPEAGLVPVLAKVLRQRDGWLCDWIARPPQTNEVGRSAVLIAAAGVVADRTGLPLDVLELGASAGLNLLFDRYGLKAGALQMKPDRPVLLSPDWRRALPGGTPFRITSRLGLDLDPLSPVDDATRLMAYVWPDQPARLARLKAALALAKNDPPQVLACDAADGLDDWLARPVVPGQCRMVYHTIAFQYFPPATQARVHAALDCAGAAASVRSPLAHLAMEADGGTGAGVTLRLWPGGPARQIARAGFHGEWVDWTGMT